MPSIASAAPVAGPSKPKFSPNSFRTLDRERAFINPSSKETKYSAPQELVAPHYQSFDALFEGAPIGKNGEVSQSHGLLDLGIKDLLPKVVFDGKGEDGNLGNRLESRWSWRGARRRGRNRADAQGVTRCSANRRSDGWTTDGAREGCPLERT